MFAKVDRRIAENLVRVKNETVLVKFLTEEKDLTLQNMALQRDEVVIRQMQGKAQYLLELLECVEKSSGIAAKFGT